MKPIIHVKNLAKSYRIGRQQRPYTTFRESIAQSVTAPVARLRQVCSKWSRPTSQRAAETLQHSESYSALQDVSFDVMPGEVLGVIGHNGAGKSTLLKILSRVTEPTTGGIDVYGRIGSLLEVGTGFHPELSGRENIYLNGAILGMRRREIQGCFDQIVQFAGVEKFLDTPVKRYSSGMYVRLAFSVAAHLETEILLVDEVLAVGDLDFQKKCLGKIGEVSSQRGRTVLIVTHNMPVVRGLCSRSILLNGGKLQAVGSTEEVVGLYLNAVTGTSAARWEYRHRGTDIKVDAVELLVNDQPVDYVQAGQACTIRMHYHALHEAALGRDVSVCFALRRDGQRLVHLWTNCHLQTIRPDRRGYVDCVIPKWPFRSYRFHVDVYTHIGVGVQEWIEDCLVFNSHDGDYFGSGIVPNPDQSTIFLDHQWSSQAVEGSGDAPAVVAVHEV